MIGISPSILPCLMLRPFPPVPTLSISGTQSGSIQLPTATPGAPLLLAELVNIRLSSRSLFPSACFFARTQAVWSSLRISPSPGPVFAVPAFGAGIEYFVPRVLNWKFFLRWTCSVGVDEVAFGEESVTDARRSVGLPHDGQNFREESLQILYH